MIEQSITLNKEQEEASQALVGPVLVIAGPGTGKTQLLSARAANLIREKNIPGEEILILTYTNAAAKSVKERLAKIVGFEGYKISSETFHGFANSIILDSEEAPEHIRERVQMEGLEKIRCLEYILNRFTDHIKALRPFGSPYFYVTDIQHRISDLKNEGITPGQFEKYLKSVAPDGIYIEKKHMPRLEELAFIYKKYEELKTGCDRNIFDERGRYDYDDMIILAVNMLKKEPFLERAYREKFKFIMVDEFQDTNGSQLKLLFSLCDGDHPNLCCVGDDDQSIYRFQGASISNFQKLKKKFPKMRIVKLRANYRSTKEIISLSSAIIKQIPGKERLDEQKKLIPRKDYRNKTIVFAKFTTEDEEIMYIVKKIKELKKIIEHSSEIPANEREKPYNQIAVLVRKRKSILKVIEGLLKSGIPYATDGKEDISAHKRVRQVINALKLAKPAIYDREEKDIALFRFLSCDFFEISQEGLFRFITLSKTKRRESGSSILEEFIASFHIKDMRKKPTRSDSNGLPVAKKIPRESLHRLHIASWVIHRLLRDSDARPLHDILMSLVEDAGIYRYILKACGENKIVITRELRSLTSFINMAKNLALARPGLKLTEFLGELETMKAHGMPIAGQVVTATQDGVRVITAHASKGLEFHACFIPFCIQDKNWPLKPYPERLPLPPGILSRKENVESKGERARLSFFDETRLFYVAASRAKSGLFFTASPTENSLSSSFFNNLGTDLAGHVESEDIILKEFFETKKKVDAGKNTEGILSDLVKNLVLTPTKLNKFLRCKRQFLYDSLLLLPGKKTSSLVVGNCAHKALEDTYCTYKKGGRFPDFAFFEDAFLRELKFQGVNKTIENSSVTKLREIKRWFEKASKNPILPINLEKKKTITLKGGIIFSGKYDKVEFENEKSRTIRVIDYKTGKPDNHIRSIENAPRLASEDCDDYFRQLVAYKMLYEKDSREKPQYKVSHGVLVFLEPAAKTSPKYSLTKGDYIDKKVAVTDDMVEELEGIIYKVWKQLNNLEFDKFSERDTKKCRNCAYDSICWE
ncbi:MAG: ATP-dependent helicase [Omnitrophica bacterium]|nr:ATP-dependent helicase [Candidatus Omnitrophota bacterium]